MIKLVIQRIFVPTFFWSRSKMIFVPKYFWSNIFFCLRKFLVQKHIWFKKSFSPKYFGPKKYVVIKFFCFNKFWPNKFFGRYRYKTAPQGYLAAGDAYTERFDRIIADIQDVWMTQYSGQQVWIAKIAKADGPIS